MNQSKHSQPSKTVKKPVQGLKRPTPVSPLEFTSLDDINIDGEGIDMIDPHYRSELEYDGYGTIEAYDNHAYNLDVEGKEDPEKELNFDGREQQPGMGEEDVIDPQENARDSEFSKDA